MDPSTSDTTATPTSEVEDLTWQLSLLPISNNSEPNINDPKYFIQFLVEDLEFLLARTPSNSVSEDKIELVMSLCEDLRLIRSFLLYVPRSIDFDMLSSPNQSNENFEAEEIPSLFLQRSIAEQIKSITKNIIEICNDGFSTISEIPRVAEMEVVFGKEEQLRTLARRLSGGPKELEIIFQFGITDEIVVAHHYYPRFKSHFNIYHRGKMSQRALGQMNMRKIWSGLCGEGDSVYKLNDPKMGERLYQRLKGKRYLIEIFVSDGIWDCGLWEDLKIYFPDDKNGSKILVKHERKHTYYPDNKDIWLENYLEIDCDIVTKLGYFGPHHGPVFSATKLQKMHQCIGIKERADLFCTNVRHIAFRLFQSPELLVLAGKLSSIKKRLEQVYAVDGFTIKSTQEGSWVIHRRESNSSVVEEEIIVGFEDEVQELLDRLTSQRKPLEVFSIVGMAGIGKTTMAKRLYNHPRVVYYFHTRGWTYVSEVYQKGNLLRKLLLHFRLDQDFLSNVSEEAMGEMLRKFLKGKKYLIVIDDIWDSKVWNDLKMYFPNDENGSKVLMTSRIKDVACNPRENNTSYSLRFLSQEESWNLFQQKMFAKEGYPEELMEIGKNMVAKCKGVPLAIVVLSGILSKIAKKSGWWWQIAENIGSYIDKDEYQLMNILELSYKHLPNSLKPCFLYLAAFPEDYEISVRKIIRMWIAEGFVAQTKGSRLEDVAENALLNLSDRSLVAVSKKRSDGGIKTFHVHDLLRKLCIKKACESNFFLPNYGYISNCSPFTRVFLNCFNCHNAFSSTHSPPNCKEFHWGHSDFVPMTWVICELYMSFIYNHRRVLDLECIILGHFPEEIFQLIRLNYLALYFDSIARVPEEIYKLWNLETLIIDVENKMKKVTLPGSIWMMVKLRHLQVSPEFEFETPWSNFSSPSMSFNQELEGRFLSSGYSEILVNLQSISWLCPLGNTRNMLLKSPNVRKLGFHLTFPNSVDSFCFFDLSNLKMLEMVKFEYQTFGMVPVSLPHPDFFPSSLRKLTLIGSHVKWEEMTIVGMLPNLEVLKVKDNFFYGPTWETPEGGFPRLKFLQFSHMDLQEWTASTDIFPLLERLVLNGCLQLAEIPPAIGDICSLQAIEVYRSSESVVNSAWKIQEYQRNVGDEVLKVFIYRQFQENVSL